MLPFLIGLFIIGAIVGFVFWLAGRGENCGEDKKSGDASKSEPFSASNSGISTEDIVLVQISSPTNTETISGENGLVWNGTPGASYEYQIGEVGKDEVVAKNSHTSTTNVFKVKSIPISYGTTYRVRIGETEVVVPFSPPLFLDSEIKDGNLTASTDVPPTNLEVLVNQKKIPLSKCEIMMEPPGFACRGLPAGEVTAMIYNGPHAANIMVL